MSERMRLEELWTSMTDNELVDLCMTCGCVLTCDWYKPGVDADKALKSLRKSSSAVVQLPANFHWVKYGTFSISTMILFALSRADRNSSWRISCSFPRIIIKEFVDDDFLDYGLVTTSLESAYDQLKFDEQVNKMSLESLKDLVFGIVRNCNDKTKEMRRTEILASSKEWN